MVAYKHLKNSAMPKNILTWCTKDFGDGNDVVLPVTSIIQNKTLTKGTDRELVVATVGGRPNKDLDVDAIRRVHTGNPNVKFLCIGRNLHSNSFRCCPK